MEWISYCVIFNVKKQKFTEEYKKTFEASYL